MSKTIHYLAGLLCVFFLVTGCSGRSGDKLPLTVIQLCDPQLGFGTDGFDADTERLRQAVRQINEIAPDLVLIAGDMVNTMDDRSVSVFKEVLSELSYPVILTPGNHEITEPVTREGLERYRKSFGDDFRTLICKGRMIISANSLLWREAPTDETEMLNRKLQDALQQAKGKDMPIILMTHIPPFENNIDEPDEYYNLPKSCRKDLLELFDENGVIIWLAGHIHRTAERKYGNIAILNGETTGRNFDNRPFGFRLLTVMPDRTFTWEFIGLK